MLEQVSGYFSINRPNQIVSATVQQCNNRYIGFSTNVNQVPQQRSTSRTTRIHVSLLHQHQLASIPSTIRNFSTFWTWSRTLLPARLLYLCYHLPDQCFPNFSPPRDDLIEAAPWILCLSSHVIGYIQLCLY